MLHKRNETITYVTHCILTMAGLTIIMIPKINLNYCALGFIKILFRPAFTHFSSKFLFLTYMTVQIFICEYDFALKTFDTQSHMLQR